jgi:hypothetical protein
MSIRLPIKGGPRARVKGFTTLKEEVRFSEISCLRVLRFLLAYILDFLLT